MRKLRRALAAVLALPLLSGCAISLGGMDGSPALRLGGGCSAYSGFDPMADPMERISGRHSVFAVMQSMQAMQRMQYASAGGPGTSPFVSRNCR